jgi:hypothetical protein
MREVSAHAQNDDRSVAAEIFAIGSYFPNTPRIFKRFYTRGSEVTAASGTTEKEHRQTQHYTM